MSTGQKYQSLSQRQATATRKSSFASPSMEACQGSMCSMMHLEFPDLEWSTDSTMQETSLSHSKPWSQSKPATAALNDSYSRPLVSESQNGSTEGRMDEGGFPVIEWSNHVEQTIYSKSQLSSYSACGSMAMRDSHRNLLVRCKAEVSKLSSMENVPPMNGALSTDHSDCQHSERCIRALLGPKPANQKHSQQNVMTFASLTITGAVSLSTRRQSRYGAYGDAL